jgi:RNA polymerase sigma-70 factor (ECF subfamily)
MARFAPRPVEDLAADVALVAGCRAGDRRSIERLYTTYSGPVQRVIGRLVGPTPDLEDLVQTTFLETLTTLDRFRGVASLKTWITRIGVHVAQHHLRAGRVRRHVSLEVVGDDALPSLTTDSDHGIDERRLAGRLHGLLDQISAKKRVALLLFVVEGRPVEEVAALMGASQTATRSRVFFARRELRALIGADPHLSSLAAGLLGNDRLGSES